MKLTKENFMLFNDNWALVTAGSLTHYNTMTISWGSLGCIWNGEDSARPIVSIYVKPCRYTHDFIENNEIFTVTFFDKKYKPDLGILGRESGRDGDKVAKTSLTPIAVGGSVGFREAETTIVCRKIYKQDFDTANMPKSVIEAYYQTEAPHTMYMGEVLEIIEKK
jgi:hypothetical protein